MFINLYLQTFFYVRTYTIYSLQSGTHLVMGLSFVTVLNCVSNCLLLQTVLTVAFSGTLFPFLYTCNKSNQLSFLNASQPLAGSLRLFYQLCDKDWPESFAEGTASDYFLTTSKCLPGTASLPAQPHTHSALHSYCKETSTGLLFGNSPPTLPSTKQGILEVSFPSLFFSCSWKFCVYPWIIIGPCLCQTKNIQCQRQAVQRQCNQMEEPSQLPSKLSPVEMLSYSLTPNPMKKNNFGHLYP